MCRRFNKPYISLENWHGAPWISEAFHEIENDYKFWAELPVINPPESIHFEFDLYLTHCPMMEARREWLTMLGYPLKRLVYSSNKTQYMLDNDIDLLIDDKLETCLEVLKAGKKVIQYVPDYLQKSRTIGTYENSDFTYSIFQIPTLINLIK